MKAVITLTKSFEVEIPEMPENSKYDNYEETEGQHLYNLDIAWDMYENDKLGDPYEVELDVLPLSF